MGKNQYCANCGTAVLASSNFCTNCGQAVTGLTSGEGAPTDVQREEVAAFNAPEGVQAGFDVSYPVSMGHRFALSRFAARLVDVWLFGLVIGLLLTAIRVSDSALESATVLAVFVLYPFVEGLLTSRFRTTPGKSLMNVRLMLKSTSVSASDYRRRALAAHFRGFAGGFPLISLLAAWFGWRNFLNTGRATWDDNSPIYAMPMGAGFLRWLAFALVLVAGVALRLFGEAAKM